VLKDGRIIERGVHAELLAKKGFYYELYMSQFKKQEEMEAVI
jgi:ATP-binding cassette subfamily B multidrug efflux pump